jgi:hypothetical protein
MTSEVSLRLVDLNHQPAKLKRSCRWQRIDNNARVSKFRPITRRRLLTRTVLLDKLPALDQK